MKNMCIFYASTTCVPSSVHMDLFFGRMHLLVVVFRYGRRSYSLFPRYFFRNLLVISNMRLIFIIEQQLALIIVNGPKPFEYDATDRTDHQFLRTQNLN